MSAETQAGLTTPTTQVFEIYIKAPAASVWDAITDPQWNAKYGYRAPMTYGLRPGGEFRVNANAEMRSMGLPDVIIDGEVLECAPPHKLVQTYRWLFSPENKAEGFTKVTWEIVPTEAGFTRLTVTHELDGAPQMAAAVKSKFSTHGGGGWSWILSDIKTLLETGKTLSE
ncbi:SRPBCC domain-containing protein [Povalibacter sp.]|uniref:SRPBCC domain-containing protein n=1 Tax=Povalibacter sp. TaxID=1962978 RepID=UPI002F4295C4